jgi:hypothetical protein
MTKTGLPDGEKIASFWRWFGDHISSFETMIDASAVESLSPLMDEALASLTCALGWEVGPGLNKDYQLAFTLKGNLENVQLAQTIVSHAPQLTHWEFHSGLPPKAWDLTFSMLNKKKQIVEIDARNWQYALVGLIVVPSLTLRLWLPTCLRWMRLPRGKQRPSFCRGFLAS